MKAVREYEEVLVGIKSVRDYKEGYFTNFFPDKNKIELWIKYKIFFKIEPVNGVLFFLKKNNDFYNLFFCAKSTESLGIAIDNISVDCEKLVVDIVGNKQMIEPLMDIFKEKDFQPYKTLVRMSRNVVHFDEIIDTNIYIAKKDNADDIYKLLYHYFDPLSEQLPLIEEIEQWIQNERIIVYRENNKIVGFVIFDLFGMKSYLRYWFVHPEHRDKKIGAKLLRLFFKLCENSQKQIFWVIDDNYNAIKRYEYYGFNPDDLFNYVLIN